MPPARGSVWRQISRTKSPVSYLHIPKHSGEVVRAGAEAQMVENVFLQRGYVWIAEPYKAGTAQTGKADS